MYGKIQNASLPPSTKPSEYTPMYPLRTCIPYRFSPANHTGFHLPTIPVFTCQPYRFSPANHTGFHLPTIPVFTCQPYRFSPANHTGFLGNIQPFRFSFESYSHCCNRLCRWLVRSHNCIITLYRSQSATRIAKFSLLLKTGKKHPKFKIPSMSRGEASLRHCQAPQGSQWCQQTALSRSSSVRFGFQASGFVGARHGSGAVLYVVPCGAQSVTGFSGPF